MSAAGWRGRRCLVTGAGGFLGSALCRRLAAEGAEVHGSIRPAGTRWRLESLPATVAVHEVDASLAEPMHELVRAIRPDWIFHTIAHDPRDYGVSIARALRDDLLSLAHLIEGTGDTAHLVQLGSHLEYAPQSRPLRESDPIQPVTLRGVGKSAASLLTLQQSAAGRIRGVVLRLAHVYGPWERPDRLVPRALAACLGGERLPLTGGTEILRDFVYVDDVVEACLLAAGQESAIGRAINVGSGIGRTNAELARTVEEVLGRPLPVDRGSFPRRPFDTGDRVADCELARDLLGWTASTSFAEGIAATAEWMRGRAG